ncbi:MAG: hypothetical protein PHH13_03690 [Candidatus Peribacteraceae bacterium]|nr:hypothetical protein [Candidatus Peribacteraceae bacterium]
MGLEAINSDNTIPVVAAEEAVKAQTASKLSALAKVTKETAGSATLKTIDIIAQPLGVAAAIGVMAYGIRMMLYPILGGKPPKLAKALGVA